MQPRSGRTDEAVVVGAGPNGLSAAITLAQRGLRVRVIERAQTVGGGARSAELTLPGFVHDVCSAIHPLAISSPFFRTLPLADYGLRWAHPAAPLAHPLDGGRAVVLERSLDATARSLGPDGAAYFRLFRAIVQPWDRIVRALLRPLRVTRDPILLARFGVNAMFSARGLAERRFRGEEARALFAGLAAHSMLPLDKIATAAFGLVLGGSGHAVGWPSPEGGAQRLADALATHLRSLGGEIVTGTEVVSLQQLAGPALTLLDLTPRQVLRVAGAVLPAGYRERLARYRYGLAAFKVDWALDGPIPWASAACRRAGTVHVGGSLAEIARAERLAWDGTPPEQPFIIVAQQSCFDSSRAPAGRHTAWAYCHVPHGATTDMTGAIEAQIDRFAPGFRNRILARHVMAPADLERHNPNLVGGDINGGVQDLWQLFTRPTLRLYATPCRGLYLCSSSTPPGGGVHGMCGYFAARGALALRT